jgi:type II secretory pathway component PulM
MRKNMIIVFVCLSVLILGICIYLFFYYESSQEAHQEQEAQVTEIEQVDIKNVYSIPNSNTHLSNTNNQVIERSASDTSLTIIENESINKKQMTTTEKKTNIVNKSFITTSKDIATF